MRSVNRERAWTKLSRSSCKKRRTKHYEAFYKVCILQSDQLNIYKHDRGVKRGLSRNNSSNVVRAGIEPATSRFQVQHPHKALGQTVSKPCWKNFQKPWATAMFAQGTPNLSHPRHYLWTLRCWMHASLYTCIPNMHPILIAHRMPSKHSEATCWSSQCCKFTLNAARNGLHVT